MSTRAESTMTLQSLIRDIRSQWPEELGQETWYLSVAVALIACCKPTLIKLLYSDIAKEKDAEQEGQMGMVSIRLKDAFMKTWTVTGIPSVITAVTALAAAEAEYNPSRTTLELGEQKSRSHYEDKQMDADLEKQGHDFMLDIYRHNLDPIMSTWGNHQHDFEWLEKRIIYGLFLSDHKILTAVETEIIVLSAMMCQELKPPAIWHIRGIRRLGVSAHAVQSLLDQIKRVASWCGKPTEGWLDVAQVEHEV